MALKNVFSVLVKIRDIWCPGGICLCLGENYKSGGRLLFGQKNKTWIIHLAAENFGDQLVISWFVLQDVY